jgi:putative ABC transport system substrate-binding protein
VGIIITFVLGCLSGLCSSEAQPPGKPVPRIAVLNTSPAPQSGLYTHARRRNLEAFQQGLRALGWVEGQNITVEYHYADPEQLADLAADVVRSQVAVLVCPGGPTVIRAAQHATRTIPIVMVSAGADPVALGFAASLAQPGGNITGTVSMQPELTAKRLELLKEVAPGVSRLAVLLHHDSLTGMAQLPEAQEAAQALGVALHVQAVRSRDDFAGAFAAMQQAGAGGLLVLTDPFLLEPHREAITTLAQQYRLPAMYPWRHYVVEAGGLMAYEPDVPAMFRRSAVYVDKILKGAKPGDLPVERPTKFALVINLKTAQALGLTIPPTLLFQADEVIR